MIEKFSEQRDFDNALGPVEFECPREPINKVEGHWGIAIFFSVAMSLVPAGLLAMLIESFLKTPLDRDAQTKVAGGCMILCAVIIASFFLWLRNWRYRRLRFAMHSNGIRWHKFAIPFDEIDLILPYEAPGAIESNMPTLAKIMYALQPKAGRAMALRRQTSYTILAKENRRQILPFLSTKFDDQGVSTILKSLATRNPSWFRDPVWRRTA